ncbi:MAG: AI-2E family transporter [Pararhodobacter sp.]|nr:AI-2E family transporter [Pararhodobacter sp.]
MALPVALQLRYWGGAALVLALVLWFLGDVIFPFILGVALAYILNPVVNRVERLGLGRVAATISIMAMALALLVLILVLVVPPLVTQAAQLADAAPDYAEALQDTLIERVPALAGAETWLRDTMDNMGGWLQERGGDLVMGLMSSARSLLSVLILLVVVPVVCIYLLIDWHSLVARVDALFPRQHAPTIRRLLAEIDSAVAAFFRGMGSVCLIMATYYGIALMAVGLQFGLVVGVTAGLLTFIPYVGAVLGGTLAIGLALFQFWGDWLSVAMVAGVFLAGQAVESYGITPRIVGRSVGLHPVWILLAIGVFGSIFGLPGLLVAVPLAAAIGVLARYGVELYMDSQLYRTGALELPDDSARPRHGDTGAPPAGTDQGIPRNDV